jgi:adenylosuccinate lyase
VTAKLSADQIDGLFDEAWHLKHVDTIFARVFGE